MSNKLFYSILTVMIVGSAFFWGYMFYSQPSADEPIPYEPTVNAEGISLTMYHSPTCGCCKRWASYLEAHGAEVISEETMNVYGIKEEYGVPGELSSCHTAIVDGYVVEGHVPVEDILNLLEERPDVTGISVPGMPENSPGMDMPSDQSYQSVLFDGETVTVYNTHR